MKKCCLLVSLILLLTANVISQTQVKSSALKITNAKGGVVYYDQQPGYSESAYTLQLHFSNPLTKIDKKIPVDLKFDNRSNYNIVDFEIPIYRNEKTWDNGIRLDTIITINYWDSTNRVEDPKDPSLTISEPVVQYFRISKYDNFGTLILHVPAGTFTDVYGNKNEEINITFKKKG